MKTCIITGAGDGIGRATAIELSKSGFYDAYALLGRNIDALNKTIASMKNGADICKKVYEIDFENVEKIPDVVNQVCADFHSVDCLLNIAGYTEPQALLSTSLENFQITYKVNVFAPFMLMRECTKYMKRKGGKILNVASTAGMTPRPGWLSDASSKASVIAMSQTLTEELAEYGIKVYCISPGRCATKLRKKLAPDEDPATIMQPNEVAQIICQLIDPAENCLDGQNIVIRKKQ